ncbi:uncharacterized protein LOC135492667 [Lineus longissimus]|uniref:uncharacterized protein LOC135492667 n=1 Tax=Lineus longissimus TaxID=88925 RepID=UPI00315DDB09
MTENRMLRGGSALSQCHTCDADCADGDTPNDLRHRDSAQGIPGANPQNSCTELRRMSTSLNFFKLYSTEAVGNSRRRLSVGNINNQYVSLQLDDELIIIICIELVAQCQDDDLLPIRMVFRKTAPYTGTIRSAAVDPEGFDYYIYYDGKNLTTRAIGFDRTDKGFYFTLEIYIGNTWLHCDQTVLVGIIKPFKQSDSGEDMVISADSEIVKAVSYSTSGIEELLNGGVIPKEDPNPCFFICKKIGKGPVHDILLMSCDPLGRYLGVDNDGHLKVLEPQTDQPEADYRLHLMFKESLSCSHCFLYDKTADVLPVAPVTNCIHAIQGLKSIPTPGLGLKMFS